jgi:tetratricopeptide (TPR) repeat protein
MLDRRSVEQRIAEGLWEEIRELPFDEQRRHVREYRFRGTALFDLLRRKSREEGRKDRQMGIRVAKLALASVEGCGDASGERVHDLRAVGFAELANARRLARDLMGSEEEFTECWAEWNAPRKQPDPLALAEICFLHGTLRMYQRRYAEAVDLLNKSLSLFEDEDDRRGQVQVLIQLAALNTHIGEPKRSIADLDRATFLIDEKAEPYLVFSVSTNKANVMARSGDYGSSMKELTKSRQLWKSVDWPLGTAEMDWVEAFVCHETGNLARAEELYISARTSFSDAHESLSGTLLALDLGVLYWDQARISEAIQTAAEVIPALQSLRLHPETLEAISILARAIRNQEVSQSLLKEVRARIQQDPLIEML